MVVAGAREADDRDATGEIPRGDRATWARFLAVAGGVLVAWGLHNGLLLPWELRNVDAAVREPSLVAMRAIVVHFANNLLAELLG